MKKSELNHCWTLIQCQYYIDISTWRCDVDSIAKAEFQPFNNANSTLSLNVAAMCQFDVDPMVKA